MWANHELLLTCGIGCSASVQERLAHEKDWIVAQRAGTGVFAAEELLRRILAQVQHPCPGPDGCLSI